NQSAAGGRIHKLRFLSFRRRSCLTQHDRCRFGLAQGPSAIKIDPVAPSAFGFASFGPKAPGMTMPDALRSSCRRLAAVLILLLQTAVGAQAGSPPAEIPLTEALVCGRVGGGGRAPFHADAIQAMIVAGEWQPPSAGDAIALPGGET